jgi:hypothetical protein
MVEGSPKFSNWWQNLLEREFWKGLLEEAKILPKL